MRRRRGPSTPDLLALLRRRWPSTTARATIALGAAVLSSLALAALPPASSTLALVAADPESGELGVAVLASAPAGVADIGWTRAGVGAVAVQGRPEPSVALRALDLLSQGVPPEQVVVAVVAEGSSPDTLQIALVDSSASAAAQSGKNVAPWNGHLEAKSYACVASGATGERAILAMGVAFETTRGDLADRLLAALEAGEQAEGSQHPKRSAALRVVRTSSPPPARGTAPPSTSAAAPSPAAPGGPGSPPEPAPAVPVTTPPPTPPAPPPIDLRVDDHQGPVAELRRLLGVLDSTVLHRLGSRPIEQTHGEDVRQAQEMLRALGFYAGEASGVLDDATIVAVRAFRREAALADLPALDAAALDALLARYREWKRKAAAPARATAPAGGAVETDILPEALEPPPAAPPPAATPPAEGGRPGPPPAP